MVDRKEWLEVRRTGIGGSDAAAILGLSQWSSPYTVWADKMGMLPEKEDTEAMRQGRELEEYVAQRFTEKSGFRVRRNNKILRHPQNDFMIANVDRLVAGRYFGLECKTTSTLNMKQFINGEFPEQYYCQCVHYMAVTGYPVWFLAVLVYGRGFYIYQLSKNKELPKPNWCESSVYVDQSEIDTLIEAEHNFWNYVDTKTPPPVDGLDATTETLETLYQGGNGGIDLFGMDADMYQYLGLKKHASELDKQIEICKQKVMQRLGDFEVGKSDKYTVTWKPQTRNTFDAKAFFKDNPEQSENAAQYYKVTTFRKFDIKENK